MLERLKNLLTRRQKVPITSRWRRPAAVLVPICFKEGQYHILFVRRAEGVKYHGGQISFPGGTYEARDGTLLDTALRECAEEIALAPEVVSVLGQLDNAVTKGSGYIISPFVAVIPWPYPFKLDKREVEELIEVPVTALMTEGCRDDSTEVIDGKTVATYHYHYRDKIIWGATARVLKQFLEIFRQAAATGAQGTGVDGG